MRRASIIVVTIVLASPAVAAEGAPSARYSMTPIEGGALRLDTFTGAVNRCVAEAGVWSCRALPDESRALQDEIDRLAEENAELRAGLAASGEGGPTADDGKVDQPTPSFRLPSEAEVDQAMSFMERVIRRFKAMVDSLNDADDKGTAL
jgi:hypothetical protein